MGMRLVVPAYEWLGPCTIRQWLKGNGEWVNAGNPICVLSVGLRHAMLIATDSGFLQLSHAKRHDVGTELHRFEWIGFVVSPGDVVSPSDLESGDREKGDPYARDSTVPASASERVTRPIPCDSPALRAVARRANPSRRLLSPRARALVRDRSLVPDAMSRFPLEHRITARERADHQPSASPSTVVAALVPGAMGRLAATLRWRVSQACEEHSIRDRIRLHLVTHIQAWTRRASGLGAGAIGRVRDGRLHYDPFARAESGKGTEHVTTLPEVDLLVLDLLDSSLDRLELPEFRRVACVIQLGRCAFRRESMGGQVTVDTPITIQFDMTTPGLEELLRLMDELRTSNPRVK